MFWSLKKIPSGNPSKNIFNWIYSLIKLYCNNLFNLKNYFNNIFVTGGNPLKKFFLWNLNALCLHFLKSSYKSNVIYFLYNNSCQTKFITFSPLLNHSFINNRILSLYLLCIAIEAIRRFKYNYSLSLWLLTILLSWLSQLGRSCHHKILIRIYRCALLHCILVWNLL